MRTAAIIARCIGLCAALSVLAHPALAQRITLDDEPLEEVAPLSSGDLDIEAPRVTHVPVVDAVEGPVVVRARIVDASPILAATLYWRHKGESAWRPEPLVGDGSRFSATIRVQRDFEFYMEAFDVAGNGPAMDGRPSAPIAVRVRSLASTLPPKPKLPPPPPMQLARVARVATARPITAGRAEFRLDGGFGLGNDFVLPGYQLAGGDGRVAVSYAVHRLLELSGSSGYRAAWQSPPPGRAGSINTARSLGDASLGLRTVLPQAPGRFRFAFEGGLDLPAPSWAESGSETTWALSAGVSAVASWLGPVALHAQLGYRFDNTERLLPGRWTQLAAMGQGLSRYDALHAGLAVEVPVAWWFVPFAEYVIDVPVDRRRFASCEAASEIGCRAAPPLFPAVAAELPQRIGAGARFEIAGHTAIVLAGEVSLTQAGRALSASDARSLPAPNGFQLPVPYAARLQLVHQLGGRKAPQAATPTASPAAAPVAKPTSPPDLRNDPGADEPTSVPQAHNAAPPDRGISP